MKKIILYILFFLLVKKNASSQNLIAVQNNNNPSFYTTLLAALGAANNGDTIYIPGGSYNLGSYYNLTKQVCLIGVGHNPDSTLATMSSSVSGTLRLMNGSSGSSIIGIYFSSNINISDGLQSSSGLNIDNITIQRCNFAGILGNYDGSGAGTCCACVSNPQADYYVIAENIIRGNIRGIDGAFNLFSNNIIEGTLTSLGQNSFKNNIFLRTASSPLGEVRNAILENNIFIISALTFGVSGVCSSSFGGQNDNFNNNLFVENITSYPILSSAIGNYISQSLSGIFLNQSGTTFSYNQNYHLQQTCIGKNGGRDGTDIGIYGGIFPWKEGSIPPNPHIQFQHIDGNTNYNGSLPVNIKVKAQDR